MKILKKFGIVNVATGVSLCQTVTENTGPGGTAVTKNVYIWTEQAEAEAAAQIQCRAQPSVAVGVTEIVKHFQLPVVGSDVD